MGSAQAKLPRTLEDARAAINAELAHHQPFGNTVSTHYPAEGTFGSRPPNRNCTKIVQEGEGGCRIRPAMFSPRQRDRTIGRSARGRGSRKCHLHQPSPCWTDSEVVLAADQDFPKGSCAHHGRWVHTRWIGNDKSPSHRQSWRLAGFRRGWAYPA